VTFTNTDRAPVAGVSLSTAVPGNQWISVVAGTAETSKTVPFSRLHRRERERDVQSPHSGPVASSGDLAECIVDQPTNGNKQSRNSGLQGAQCPTRQDQRVSRSLQVLLPTGQTHFYRALQCRFRKRVYFQLDVDRAPARQAIFSAIKIPVGTKLRPAASTCSVSPTPAGGPCAHRRQHHLCQEHGWNVDGPTPSPSILAPAWNA